MNKQGLDLLHGTIDVKEHRLTIRLQLHFVRLAIGVLFELSLEQTAIISWRLLEYLEIRFGLSSLAGSILLVHDVERLQYFLVPRQHHVDDFGTLLDVYCHALLVV